MNICNELGFHIVECLLLIVIHFYKGWSSYRYQTDILRPGTFYMKINDYMVIFGPL